MNRKALATLCLHALFLVSLASIPPTAHASFHLMQIEQAIGGICGDTTQQVIQLRMRSGGQNEITGTRLVAYDALGLNPVVLVVFGDDVSGASAGSRILTVDMNLMVGGALADFFLETPIPADYLRAGRLTFEKNGSVYWSLAWGGAHYTGSNSGLLTNDDDGDFGMAFPGPLPSSTNQALEFQGAANAMSTENTADYALTPGAATFTINFGSNFSVGDCLWGNDFETGDLGLWSANVGS